MSLIVRTCSLFAGTGGLRLMAPFSPGFCKERKIRQNPQNVGKSEVNTEPSPTQGPWGIVPGPVVNRGHTSWQQLGKFSGLPLDLGLFGNEKIHVLRFVG